MLGLVLLRNRSVFHISDRHGAQYPSRVVDPSVIRFADLYLFLSFEVYDVPSILQSSFLSHWETKCFGGGHSQRGDNMVEPPAQRARTDVLWTDLVSSEIVNSKVDLRNEYLGGQPYPHVLFPRILKGEFLSCVLEEVKAHSQVNFKESDLFRVYQSIDLGNIKVDDPSNREKLPNTLQLRELLSSNEWRAFVEEVAGLSPGTLTSQIDCAFNCHAPGCHLLCHDDVIGTRKISYIIYLTDEDWTENQGGSLELYDRSSGSGSPECVPAKTVLPLFNHMALFEVKPGVSFHAVQEVFGERPRLSLQGWYHAASPPDQSDAATLAQLKKTDDAGATHEAIDRRQTLSSSSSADDKSCLSKEDRDFLSSYLHSTYLGEASMRSIQKSFEENSSVQLRGFMKVEWSNKLSAILQNEKSTPNDRKYGVVDGWELVGPSHKQRYLEYTSNSTEEDPKQTGPVLRHLKNVLQSPSFARYLQLLTSLKPIAQRGCIRRFRPGLDYTVAHYGLLQQEAVLDATLCFVDGEGHDIAERESPLEADVAWQSGDVGGFECYIEAEDETDQGAADEYDQEDDTELLSVSASNNTLSLVYRDPGTLRFVKYVGAQAPSSRYDIAMEYECEDSGDDASVTEAE